MLVQSVIILCLIIIIHVCHKINFDIANIIALLSLMHWLVFHIGN